MVKLVIELEPEEIFELMSFCGGLIGSQEDKIVIGDPPLFTMAQKIYEAGSPLLTNEQGFELLTTLNAIQKVMSVPSVERGAMLGGFLGLQDRLDEELQKGDDE